MYKSFEMSNFRSFKHCEIRDLGRINLITGLNNVGKTSFLEALFLHCGAYNSSLILNILNFRGIAKMELKLGNEVETPWNSLFNIYSKDNKIELKGFSDDNKYSYLSLRIIHDQNELNEISKKLSYKITKPTGELFAAPRTVEVLELEYNNGEQKGFNYLILDSSGIHQEPIPSSPSFPTYFLSIRKSIDFADDAKLFGKIEVNLNKKEVIDALKLIEPLLKDVSMIFWLGNPVLHGDIGMNRLIPLPLLGEGMVRLNNIILRIINAKDGVVLIDEIESGFHHTVVPKVWEIINKMSKRFNTQIFATTHSMECIIAAYNTFKKEEADEFKLYRLDKKGDSVKPNSYSLKLLETAIEGELEVR